MKVAVLGSSGGMGRLFCRYFLSKGREVVGSDPERRVIRDPRFRLADSNVTAVRDADVVLIATPIEKTVETLAEVEKALVPGVCVVEITSVKGRMLEALSKRVDARNARLISLHPLFGPSLGPRSEMKLCVIRTDPRSLARARSLFPDANLITMSAQDHDRSMGIILSLTHLLNIAYAGTVRRFLSPTEFRKLQTPTSAVQLTLAEGVISQSPSLYSHIQLENDYSAVYARALGEELRVLLSLIERKDKTAFEKRFAEISKGFAGDSKAALDLVYQAFERASP